MLRPALRKTVDWCKRQARWLLAAIVHVRDLGIGGFAIFGVFGLLPVSVVAIIFFWVVLSYPGSCMERAIRLTGMLLQLAGVATVALKLWAAQGQFQRPTKPYSLRQW